MSMPRREPRDRDLQLLRSFGAADGREDALRRKIAAGIEVDRQSHIEISPWLDCDRLEDPDLDPERVAAAASARISGPSHPSYGALSDSAVSILADLSSGGETPTRHQSESAPAGCSSTRVLLVIAVVGALFLAVDLLAARMAAVFRGQTLSK